MPGRGPVLQTLWVGANRDRRRIATQRVCCGHLGIILP